MEEPYPACTGVAAVAGHAPGTYMPVRYQGSVTVKYRFPGKAAVSRKIKVEDHTTELILGPDGN